MLHHGVVQCRVCHRTAPGVIKQRCFATAGVGGASSLHCHCTWCGSKFETATKHLKEVLWTGGNKKLQIADVAT